MLSGAGDIKRREGERAPGLRKIGQSATNLWTCAASIQPVCTEHQNALPRPQQARVPHPRSTTGLSLAPTTDSSPGPPLPHPAFPFRSPSPAHPSPVAHLVLPLPTFWTSPSPRQFPPSEGPELSALPNSRSLSTPATVSQQCGQTKSDELCPASSRTLYSWIQASSLKLKCIIDPRIKRSSVP